MTQNYLLTIDTQTAPGDKEEYLESAAVVEFLLYDLLNAPDRYSDAQEKVEADYLICLEKDRLQCKLMLELDSTQVKKDVFVSAFKDKFPKVKVTKRKA